MYTTTLRVFALALAVCAVEGRHEAFPRSRAHRGHAASNITARRTFTVADWYQGQTFLECVFQLLPG